MKLSSKYHEHFLLFFAMNIHFEVFNCREDRPNIHDSSMIHPWFMIMAWFPLFMDAHGCYFIKLEKPWIVFRKVTNFCQFLLMAH